MNYDMSKHDGFENNRHAEPSAVEGLGMLFSDFERGLDEFAKLIVKVRAEIKETQDAYVARNKEKKDPQAQAESQECEGGADGRDVERSLVRNISRSESGVSSELPVLSCREIG